MSEDETDEPNDLSTFIGVIYEFEDSGIRVRDSYWGRDKRDFFVQVEGETTLRRVRAVTGDDDQIVVIVNRDAANRLGEALG